MINTTNRVAFEKSCDDLANFLDQWANAIDLTTGLTNAEAALADIEEMIDYTSVELAEELIHTNKIFENKDSYVITQHAYKADDITYFRNISHVTSLMELCALLRRADVVNTISQNVYRPAEFSITMSYRKISPNRWGVVHKSSSLDTLPLCQT